MNCTNCNNSISLNAKFCGKCGSAVVTTDTNSTKIDSVKSIDIKCGSCGYTGKGELNRTISAQIVVWLCLFVWPIVPLLYYILIKKMRCPQCKSTFVGVKDEFGNFTDQKTSIVKAFVIILVGLALVGIVSGIILTSLNQARLKNHNNNQSTQTSTEHSE